VAHNKILLQVKQQKRKAKLILMAALTTTCSLLALVMSVKAFDFGTYECHNNCPSNAKYGNFIGTTQASGMSGVGVFGAYSGNLY